MAVAIIISAILIAGAILIGLSNLSSEIKSLSENIKWLKDYVEKRSNNKWDDKFYIPK